MNTEEKNVSVIRRKNNDITTHRSYGGKELQLIRRTVAKDTTQEEFDMFIEICRRQGIDPFRRQIYALVFNKDDKNKRQVSFITGIDGYRAIAKRTGNYRPDDEEYEIEYDESMKCPDTNPKGIKKATVKVWQYAKDGWYPIIGRALWEEFAPIRGEVEWVEQYDGKGDVILETEGRWKGKPKRKPQPKEGGRKWLEKEIWKTMSEHMIAKCAEAQALRKGWPEEMGGIYTEEEMHRAQVDDLIASEVIEVYEEEERLRAIGGYNTIPMIMAQTEGLEMIPEGKMFDTVMELINQIDDPKEIDFWKDRNRHGLNQYWATSKGDALALKQAIEKRQQELLEENKHGNQ